MAQLIYGESRTDHYIYLEYTFEPGIIFEPRVNFWTKRMAEAVQKVYRNDSGKEFNAIFENITDWRTCP